jgi:hypothetical protein
MNNNFMKKWDVVLWGQIYACQLACAALLGFLCLPRVQAGQSGDFGYDVSTNLTVTITNYTGAGGSVTIPDTIEGMPVKSIDSWVFSSRADLTEVIMASSVTSIGQRVFNNCSGITNLALSKSLGVIPDSAFSGCGRLETVILPDSVTKVEASAFSYCSSLKTLRLSTNLVSLEANAFSFSTNLASVCLPASLATVSGNPFAGCGALVNLAVAAENPWLVHCDGIVFSRDLHELQLYPAGRPGDYSLPAGTLSIANGGFAGCEKLSAITIGATVTNIGLDAFFYCPALASISVAPENLYYSSVAGVLFDHDQTQLIQCPGALAGKYVMPSTVQYIGADAFSYCLGLTNVVFSAGVTNIGYSAFSFCRNLECVVLSASLKAINEQAFSDCTNLQALYFKTYFPPRFVGTGIFTHDTLVTFYIPADATGWGNVANEPSQSWEYNSVFGYAPLSATAIIITNCVSTNENITVPATLDGFTVASLANGLFSNRFKLKSVTLPDTVTNIGEKTFYMCGQLTNVHLPSSLTVIGRETFTYCSKLAQITLPDTVTTIDTNAFYYCTALTNIYLPQGLTAIRSAAFIHCAKLTQIDLPSSLETIGRQAFSSCSSLEIVYFPASLNNIDDSAFTSCPLLRQVCFRGSPPATMGHNVFSTSDLVVYRLASATGWEATYQGHPVQFWSDTARFAYQMLDDHHAKISRYLGKDSAVTIPETLDGIFVTQIGSWAFDENTLTSLSMPQSIIKIDDYSFCDRYKLTNIIFSTNLTSIGARAFVNCVNLTKLELPASITNIGMVAFQNCNRLELDTLPNSLKSLANGVFFSCHSLTNLVIGKSVQSVGDYCFSDCIHLANVVLEDSVTNVGYATFAGCTSLTNVFFSTNLALAGSNVFYGCVSLTNITLPDSLLSLSCGLFSGCSNLANVRLPNSLTNVSGAAFQDCASLTSLTLPQSLFYLDSSAFSGCASLTQLDFEGNAPMLLGATSLPDSVTVYYHAGANGWSNNFGGRPASEWVDTSLFAYRPIDGATIEITRYSGTNTTVNVPAAIDGFTVKSLGANAFAGNLALAEVNLPAPLVTVGDLAFADCVNLASVTLGSNVTRLGNGAFSDCRSLPSVSLPDSLVALGTNVFAGCDTLTNLSASWQNPAFFSRDGVLHSITPLGVLLCPPGKSGGFTVDTNVTVIADYAFAGCSQLQRLWFSGPPVPLQGDHVFEDATHLTIYYYAGATGWSDTYGGRPVAEWSSDIIYSYQITGPSSVVIVGYVGDGGYVNLPSTLNDKTVVGVAANAFAGRADITGVSIPATITNIAPGAFYGCSQLSNFSVDWFNPALVALGGVLMDKSRQVIIQYPPGLAGDYIVPETVVSLGEKSFAGCAGLRRVCFLGEPPSLQGEHVFAGASLATVCYVEGYAGWTTTYGGVSATTWGEPLPYTYETPSGLNVKITKYLGYRAQVTVPETIAGLPVVEVGNSAFAWCQGITSLVLPTNLTTIGYFAFANCKGLKDLKLTENILVIGEQAFNGCSSLERVVIPDSVTCVSFAAFGFCSELKSVSVGKGVNSLDGQCFLYCSNLTQITISPDNALLSDKDGVVLSKDRSSLIVVPPGREGNYTIPEGVTNLAAHAFATCGKLSSITVPASLTYLDPEVFSDCTSLTRLEFEGDAPHLTSSALFPNNLKVNYQYGTQGWGWSLGGCQVEIIPRDSLYEYTQLDGVHIEITKFYGNSPLVFVPSAINGLAVKSIGLNAFAWRSTLTSVILPEGLVSLGNQAFAFCAGLTNITLPQSLAAIGSQTFYGCAKLSQVTLGTNVASLDSQAFAAASLTNIGVADGNPYFRSQDGVLFDSSMRSLLQFPAGRKGRYAVPGGVVTLGEHAFFQSQLMVVDVPASVTGFQAYAFAQCPALQALYFSGAAPAVADDSVFDQSSQVVAHGLAGTSGWEKCVLGGRPVQTWLRQAECDYTILPTGLAQIIHYNATNSDWWVPGYLAGHLVDSIAPYAFAGNATLTNVVTYFTGIGPGAFADCPNLIHVNLNIGGSAIPSSLFQGCSSLVEVLVNPGASRIDSLAFADCPNFRQLIMFGNAPAAVAPDAFASSPNLVVCRLRHTTGWGDELGGRPVAYWRSPSDCDYEDLDGYRMRITRYHGTNALYYVPMIIDDLLLTSIGANAFAGCTTLQSAILPNTVGEILSGAFSGCTGLTNIALADGITNIAADAFNGCAALTSITIGKGLAALGDRAFANCHNLTAVFFNGDAPAQVGEAVFSEHPDVVVYYLAGTQGWSNSLAGRPVRLWGSLLDFTYKITGTNEVRIEQYIGAGGAVVIPETFDGFTVTSLRSNAFSYCVSVSAVTLPNSVLSIGKEAFSGCSNLESVVLGTNLTSIGPGAFVACAKLGSVNLPASLSSLGDYAFSFCPAMTNLVVDPLNPYFYSVDGVLFNRVTAEFIQYPIGRGGAYTVPATVGSIGAYAFIQAAGLTNIVIPLSVTNIGESAFYRCDSLSQITFTAGMRPAGLNQGETPLMIGPSAFAGCIRLTTLVLPENLVSIQERAFYGCDQLENIVMPSAVTHIGPRAFSACARLAALNCGGELQTLGEYALAGCTSLATLELPRSLTRVDEGAFSGCPSLTALHFAGNAPELAGTNTFFVTNGVSQATVYYYDDTTGWGVTFGGQPTVKLHRATPFEQWTATSGLAAQFPNACGESDDADHDGMSNLQEMYAGTDPTSAKSALAFESTARLEALSDEDKTPVPADKIAFYIQTVPGMTYDLERCDQLNSEWSTATTVTATSTQKRVVLARPAGNAFYRVVVRP